MTSNLSAGIILLIFSIIMFLLIPLLLQKKGITHDTVIGSFVFVFIGLFFAIGSSIGFVNYGKMQEYENLSAKAKTYNLGEYVHKGSESPTYVWSGNLQYVFTKEKND